MSVVRDPGDLYEVSPDAPVLDGAVMLHYLDGFIDAGAAGKLLSAHLLGTLEHEEVARFDVDRLIDYRSRRPPMIFSQDHWESYDAPELAMHLLTDTDGQAVPAAHRPRAGPRVGELHPGGPGCVGPDGRPAGGRASTASRWAPRTPGRSASPPTPPAPA